MKSLYLIITILLIGSAELYGQASCATATSWGNDPIAEGTQSCTGSVSTWDTNIEAGWTGSQCGATVTREFWATFTITDGSTPNYEFWVDNISSGGPGDRAFGFQVFSGACGSLSLLDCDNDETLGIAESETIYNLPDGTYYLRVIGYGSSFDFQICLTNVPDPPANDECANAIPIAVGANGICNSVVGTNTGATSSITPAPGCGVYSGGDVWYSVTVPASGNVTFATEYAAVDALTNVDIAIYSGTCGSLSLIACDDLSGTGSMGSIAATGLTPGSTVYVRVWENGDDVWGNFNLCFSEPVEPDDNQDCATKTALCNDATIAGASNGAGSVVDLGATNRGCLSGDEHQSSWYNLKIATAGTFAFTISPDNGTDDYDFSVWHYVGGAGQSCPPNRNPDRCTFGAGAGLNSSYDTGMGQGAVDTSEDTGGDNWVAELNVAVDDEIVMLIDNYSSTTSPFTLDFTGTCGLDCSIILLPVEMLTFYVKKVKSNNVIYWSTASEKNNAYFTIEHSLDAENWREIGKVSGAGNSNEKLTYEFVHFNPAHAVNYYRIHQTDFDGTKSNYKIVSLNNSMDGKIVVKTTNMLGQEVDSNYKGVVIDIFEDGSSSKRYQ